MHPHTGSYIHAYNIIIEQECVLYEIERGGREGGRKGESLLTSMNPSRSKVVDWKVNMKSPVTIKATTPI